MITTPQNSLHKSYINRILTDISDDIFLSQTLIFKGGTCATMLGFLDRFSVDIDLDCFDPDKIPEAKTRLLHIFKTHNLIIKKTFDQAIMYELKYPNPQGRSTLKLSINTIPSPNDQHYTPYFPDINRHLVSQTIETMFANKLVAIKGRFDKHHAVAGRDLYDIHHFFISGYTYHIPVIENRTHQSIGDYFEYLIKFIPSHFNQTIINQDLNHLLTLEQFNSIRKILLPETISLLKLELNKLSS